MMCSPQGGLSAPMDRWKVVMFPRRGSDPTSGHPRAQKPPLGRGSPLPALGVHLDTPGQRRGWLPSSFVWTLTQGSETGKVQGLRWHNLPRERKGE